MSNEDFIKRQAKTIAALWSGVTQRYGLTESDFAARLQAGVKRSVTSGNSAEIREFLERVRADELCLAMACERGDEAAWRDFETAFRQTMNSAARALTKDEVEAEELAQSLFGELYGMRVEGEQRMSKLSHYSGRGSLGGWLRAVVYQAFIDRKRQAARFEQVEDAAEFDRLASHASLTPALAVQNGNLVSAHLRQPDDIEDERLQRLTEEAMTEAFAALEAKDRLLLNYYYFDELTLREIGLLVGVHEATISRWLARTQQTVRKKTEDLLQRKHGLRRGEVSECLQIAARAELDLRKMIGEATGPSAERAP
ncbi:MAG TPA: sigma-70 family RNA polymerase sigma factor [Blastocatellia bacterium]|nr:sigma-70 family RNA polymerase sigma factor [Blastocatellia bacterium]